MPYAPNDAPKAGGDPLLRVKFLIDQGMSPSEAHQQVIRQDSLRTAAANGPRIAREEADLQARLRNEAQYGIGAPMPQTMGGMNMGKVARRGLTPADLDPVDAASSQIVMDEELRPRTPDELRAMGLNPMTEPGVRMPDGSMRPVRELPNAQAARAYNDRTPLIPETQPSAPGRQRYAPSLRDLDMERRGYVPVWNDDGTVSYMLSPNTGTRGLPGAMGRGGLRADLESPTVYADGREYTETLPAVPVNGVVGNPTAVAVPRFVEERVDGPNGPQYVYRPSEPTRRINDAYQRERKIYRMAAAAGISPEEYAKRFPDEVGDLTAGGLRGGAGGRMLAEGKRQEDAEARKQAFKSQMMLAGASPRRNLVNAYERLGDPNITDEQRDALRYMMPGGQLAAQVDSQNMEAAAGLAQRAVAGMANTNPLLPVQARLLEEEAIAKRRLNRQPDEDLLADKYARRQWRGPIPWGYDEFEPAEQNQMKQDLIGQGYTEADALSAVRRIARDRNATVRI